MIFKLLLVAAFFWSPFAIGQSANQETILFRDARVYINAIERIHRLGIEDQIDAWQTFLLDNPQHTFRREIQSNLDKLEKISPRGGQGSGDGQDAELYLKALEFSKKLSPQDQIRLWEQFLDENPQTIYQNEVQIRLNKLRRKYPQQRPKKISQPAPQPVEEKPVRPTQKITKPKPLKDPERALMLASLPGIIVPGMGHWYTEDYIVAGFLTAIRVAGIAVGSIGIAQRNNSDIFLGVGLAVLSWGIDIGDAPFSANRYNEAHQHSQQMIQPVDQGMTVPIFSYAARF